MHWLRIMSGEAGLVVAGNLLPKLEGGSSVGNSYIGMLEDISSRRQQAKLTDRQNQPWSLQKLQWSLEKLQWTLELLQWSLEELQWSLEQLQWSLEQLQWSLEKLQ